MSIEIHNITKTFGAFKALDNVSLEIKTGELIALLGRSGSGKTTLLRVLGGLEIPDSGQVLFHGEEATDRSARQRQVGFVFQHYALFRHMTVFENVAFGLRVRPRNLRPSEDQIGKRVRELLNLVQLDWVADRYASQLSGGQRQRIALARALAVEPRILLLDEPFGALDAKVRRDLRQWLKRLHDDLHITTVFVTHDQEEALELGNRVVLFHEGRVEQVGTPDEVYNHPATPFVFEFLGNVNLFHGRVEDGRFRIGPSLPAEPINGNGTARKSKVYVRPHLLEVSNSPAGQDSFAATVRHINSAGPLVKLELLSEWGDPVSAEISHERFRALDLEPQARVYLSPKENRVFVYQI
ncbi:MAG TPA: sulfate ABC transporter ATP-binding protein [Candidatus Binataceae bacterium]|nr:sulfate ABC transporter ATP-binding protein [Candidatus Binataceae bacterium]